MPDTSATLARPIEVVRHGPTIGAEVRGVDLSRPVDEVTFQAIHAALMAHKVIYFRDQDITPEQQVAFGKLFGSLTVHPFVPHLEHLPEVLVLDNHQDNPVFATDVWHSDETFRVTPPMGSILRCVRIPEAGGDTLWADMVAAYENLSDKMQRFLSGLEAIHDFIPFRRKFDALPARERHAKLAEMEEELPNPTHPVVRTHPVTGQRALYVNEQFTVAIKDMREDESRALLDFLIAQPRIPEFQFRFRWAPHSIVFWDNRPTQHYAANDYYPTRRTMHRVTIKGDQRPV
jgi:taurine dioxygenase